METDSATTRGGSCNGKAPVGSDNVPSNMKEVRVVDLSGDFLFLRGAFTTGSDVRRAVALSKKVPQNLCMLYWDTSAPSIARTPSNASSSVPQSIRGDEVVRSTTSGGIYFQQDATPPVQSPAMSGASFTSSQREHWNTAAAGYVDRGSTSTHTRTSQHGFTTGPPSGELEQQEEQQAHSPPAFPEAPQYNRVIVGTSPSAPSSGIPVARGGSLVFSPTVTVTTPAPSNQHQRARHDMNTTSSPSPASPLTAHSQELTLSAHNGTRGSISSNQEAESQNNQRPHLPQDDTGQSLREMARQGPENMSWSPQIDRSAGDAKSTVNGMMCNSPTADPATDPIFVNKEQGKRGAGAPYADFDAHMQDVSASFANLHQTTLQKFIDAPSTKRHLQNADGTFYDQESNPALSTPDEEDSDAGSRSAPFHHQVGEITSNLIMIATASKSVTPHRGENVPQPLRGPRAPSPGGSLSRNYEQPIGSLGRSRTNSTSNGYAAQDSRLLLPPIHLLRGERSGDGASDAGSHTATSDRSSLPEGRIRFLADEEPLNWDVLLSRYGSVPTLRLMVTIRDFSKFPRQPTEVDWRGLSESGKLHCRDFVYQEEYLKTNQSLPTLLCYFANRTGLDTLLEAYLENEDRTPIAALLDVENVVSEYKRGGETEHLPRNAESRSPEPYSDEDTHSGRSVSSSSVHSLPSAGLGGGQHGGIARPSSLEQLHRSPGSHPQLGRLQRNWPPLFFLLRKAEFSARIRKKLLNRSDIEELLNWIHPETHETCFILGGLFCGGSFLSECLQCVRISSLCLNAVSTLCSVTERTCSTCLANFYQVGCRDGFDMALQREDLDLAMLETTEVYFTYLSQKNAESSRKSGRKASKKMHDLAWYSERVRNKIQTTRTERGTQPIRSCTM
ncbi:unnamed protein product [Amoebophrya sp. A25]|nr:unnamed protein product [Amoebophrya sp. A25]|eukprot:GSA25T00007610001.1